MTLKLKRTPGLYLVGFMGAGKSTVGRSLADELGWCFFDLDQEIEMEQGRSIADIFVQQGEPAFRQVEAQVLRRRVSYIESGNPCVMALGGGAFAQSENWQLIEDNGITVWLDCPLERIRNRLGDCKVRPLAADRLAMEKLFEARRPYYARADFRIDANHDDPADILQQILRLPIF